MVRLSNARVWWIAGSVTTLAVTVALLASWLGAKVEQIVGVLGGFVYLETFVAILWYTMETRRMQESVTQQATLIANSLRGSLYESMRNAMMQINQLFVGAPNLRPYFYENTKFARDAKDDANTKLYHELSSVADSILDIFESVKRHIREFPDEEPEYQEAWENYIRFVFENSPFLRDHLAKHPDWYVRELQQYVKAPILNPFPAAPPGGLVQPLPPDCQEPTRVGKEEKRESASTSSTS